jgi:predicted DsbA family dithiol-disulfide isomerase
MTVAAAIPVLTLSIYSSPLCPFCLLGWRKIQRAMAASPGVEFKIRYAPPPPSLTPSLLLLLL